MIRDQEDLRVISACRAGDFEQYRVLVEKYQGRLYAMAYAVVLDRGTAQDVVQEALIKGFRSLKKFRGDSGFYTWIYRIARNLAIDAIRRRRPEVPYEDSREVNCASAPERPDASLKRKELQEMVREAMSQLTPQQRAVLVLREWEGLSYREMAERLNCSLGTVMSRLHYAREKLADRLRQKMGGVGEERE